MLNDNNDNMRALKVPAASFHLREEGFSLDCGYKKRRPVEKDGTSALLVKEEAREMDKHLQ